MRVTKGMIDRELRFSGSLIKIVNNNFTEKRLRLFNILMKKVMRYNSNSLQYKEVWIPRKDGSRMRICLYKPLEPKANVPGILWLHGGGYAIGVPEQAQVRAEKFIEVSNSIVIAPDYRLSVEAPYPAALEDSYEALLWMKNHAKELGIRDDQLMVGGESAGGGLAAALTLYARDKGEVAIAFQMPLYPMLDDRMNSESAKDNDAPLWNSKSNYYCWKLYLGDLFGSADVPCYAAPARAKNYCKLPPAATFVGELEPFRDETIQFVESLRKAGVTVDFEIYKGCYHAFDMICPKAEISKEAISFLLNSFEYAVNHYFAEQKCCRRG